MEPFTVVQIKEYELKIGRIIGGIGWPGYNKEMKQSFPGYVCVLGESYYPEPEHHAFHPVYLLCEHCSNNKDELIKKCVDWQTRYYVDQWFGRMDENQTEYIHHWNNKVRKRGVQSFYVQEAVRSKPSGLIGTHIDVIRSCIRPDNMVLYNIANSMFMIQHNHITETYSRLTDQDFPAVAGFGYALIYLREYLPENPYDQEEGELITTRRNTLSDGY